MENREMAQSAIKGLKKTAMLAIVTLDEDSGRLCEQLHVLAESLQKHFGVPQEVMEQYDSDISSFEAEDEIDTESINGYELDNTIDSVEMLCNTLDDPKQIMRCVHTTFEMYRMWHPEYAIKK